MNDLAVPVIDRLMELAAAKLIEVDGFTYIDKDKTCTMFTPPVPAPVQVDTLAGFVQLLENRFEGFDPLVCMVHVYKYDTVLLTGEVSDKFGRRQIYVKAVAAKPERTFNFNQYYPQEEFNIALRSMFVQDDELNSLVALAGNIAKQSELKQVDDGFSQEVSAKSGIAMVKTVTIKPRVTLKLLRTFLEVEQPAGDYIFRVKSSEQQGNQCALFEADGGMWKLTAMQTIQAWLQQKIKTSSVAEITSLPVIA